MKHLTALLLSITLASTIQHSHCYIDQDFDAKLNLFQQRLDILIDQSNLDPEVAQDLKDKANDLGIYIQNNIQQDLQDIRVAAALTSLLETADKMAQNANMTNIHNLLGDVKYAARANAIQKLLIGAYPGAFKDELYYTDPYTESIGFTLNDYIFNTFFTALVNLVTPTVLGAALKLDSSSPVKKWVTRITAGLTAHYAWLLQKKLAANQFTTIEKQNS